MAGLENYSNVDMTGEDPRYLEEVNLFYVEGTGSRIEFNPVVYRERMVITLPGVSGVETLIEGVDYYFDDVDIDVTMRAKLKAIDETFSLNPVKSVTFMRPGSYRVNIASQHVFPIAVRHRLSPSGAVDLNPQVIAELMQAVSTFNAERNARSLGTPLTNTEVVSLPEDPNKQDPGNIVRDEQWLVNTLDGHGFIIPKHGSFFRGSEVLRLETTNRVLVRGTDYEVVRMNLKKTQVTSWNLGVYDLILLMVPYAGIVVIDEYHAFGGEALREDVLELLGGLTNVEKFLTSQSFITPVNLVQLPVMLNMDDRLTRAEAQLRTLSPGGYMGDVTNGLFTRHRLRANNTGLNWWTIASLWKIDGDNTTIFTNDRFAFRFTLAGAGISGLVKVAAKVDSVNPVVSIESENVILDMKYKLFGAESPATPFVPMVRVVYGIDGGSLPGAYLQIGLQITALEDTLLLEDQSGPASAWKLKIGSAVAVLPENTDFLLPDGLSTWVDGATGSYKSVHSVPTQIPYRLWSGAVDLGGLSSPIAIENPPLPIHFRLQDVKVVKFVTQGNANPDKIKTYEGEAVSLDGSTLVVTLLNETLTLVLEKTSVFTGSITASGFAGETLRYVLLEV